MFVLMNIVFFFNVFVVIVFVIISKINIAIYSCFCLFQFAWGSQCLGYIISTTYSQTNVIATNKKEREINETNEDKNGGTRIQKNDG